MYIFSPSTMQDEFIHGIFCCGLINKHIFFLFCFNTFYIPSVLKRGLFQVYADNCQSFYFIITLAVVVYMIYKIH